MNGSRPQWWVSEMGSWGLDGKEEEEEEDCLVVGSSYRCGDTPHLRVVWICRVGTGEWVRDL